MGNQCGATPSDPYHVNLCMLSYITKAARIFGINRTTVYRWLDKPNLETIRVVRKKRKIDIARLEQDVAKYPDKTLKQRAQEFGV